MHPIYTICPLSPSCSGSWYSLCGLDYIATEALSVGKVECFKENCFKALPDLSPNSVPKSSSTQA